MWERFGGELAGSSGGSASVSDIMDHFARVYLFVLLGTEALTVITVLIIIGMLSSREKKR